MSGFEGFVVAAAQIGLQNVLVKPKRGLFNINFTNVTTLPLPSIIAPATVEERHLDRLEITDHPVEYGANISDHAFKMPSEVMLTLAWSNSPQSTNLLNSLTSSVAAVNDVAQGAANLFGIGRGISTTSSLFSGSNMNQIRAAYSALLQLMDTRALFDIWTGKRVYQNMICQSLLTETDFEKENVLIVTMECREVLLVNTQIVALPAATQSNASETQSQTEKGQQNFIQR